MTSSVGIATAAAVFAGAIGFWCGTYSAGDTDPFGYVSQADLIASGALRVELHADTAFPVPENEAALVPAGYVLSADRRAAVPMYPPGLPLMMAVMQRVTGHRGAVFQVVPVAAAVCVLLTFVLGARCLGRASGAVAATLLATTPVFLLQTVQPVSDIPATAWWTAAVILVLVGGPGPSLLAGVCVSLAVLTRPHLVPLAAILGLALILRVWRVDATKRRGAWWSVVCFSLGSVPAPLVIALLNEQFHGSPFVSGYGRLPDLFRWDHVLPNLDRYPRWMLTTQTPFIFLGVVAPVVLRRKVAERARRTIPLLLTLASVVFLLTIFYGYFGRDEWGYLRFMLPAMPALLVLSAAVVERALRALVADVRIVNALLVTLTIVVAGWQLREADKRGVFQLRDVERRYVDVGRFIDGALPPTAVFVAQLHSGSIRYYANRQTVHFPRLRRGSLDVAIRRLHEQGRDVFIVLEDGEREAFRSRFESSEFARLDWPAAQRTSRGVPVGIWNTRDRAAFLAGAPVVTGDIHLVRKPVVTEPHGPRASPPP